MSAGQKGARNVLDQAGLEQLTDAWDIWAGRATTPGRSIGRSRVYLFFLLARYGGMRPGEIGAFRRSDLDSATGLLQTGDRRIFLPAGAMRPIRRIMSLPEAGEPDFLQMDAGFLRRTFYAVAELANLPPALCAPRALRYARACELLAMRVNPDTVAKSLGFKNPLHLTSLLPLPAAANAKSGNRFTCLITALETGNRTARIFFRLAPHIDLYCICPLENLLMLEPRIGHTATIHIPPASVFPAQAFENCANELECHLLSTEADQHELRLHLAINAHMQLLALVARNNTNSGLFAPGEKLAVHIPPHSIELCQTDL